MSGVDHILEAFYQANERGRAALMPYFTLGYPTQGESIRIVEALAGAGADLIELGIPFSDPLADGPTIQYSTHEALQKGMSVLRCLEMIRQIRQRKVTQPLLLMGYINPLLSYGIQQFITDAQGAGADGLILPDLPVDEAAEVENACRDSGLALVYLVSPTTPIDRVKLLASHSTGFLYLLSVNGVTGARESLPADLNEFITRVRKVAALPLAVGFGISTPDHAKMVGRLADGVIIGSALIDAARGSENPGTSAADFLKSFDQALSENAEKECN